MEDKVAARSRCGGNLESCGQHHVLRLVVIFLGDLGLGFGIGLLPSACLVSEIPDVKTFNEVSVGGGWSQLKTVKSFLKVTFVTSPPCNLPQDCCEVENCLAVGCDEVHLWSWTATMRRSSITRDMALSASAAVRVVLRKLRR